ncbi:TIGR02611 family protein [Paramicrobacterium humi]|uniref:TIGR02611 family protein n=1 Tax=Paramicrobacterium humi TaxID=640635 RepID=A0A1H4IZK1_9MICO|nr:TIGR02611 family protein [Microbacterium humi]SEB39480.1 TIGR02611 family protein [Microbacterium humi]
MAFESEISADIVRGESSSHPLHRMLRQLRARLDGYPRLRRGYRIALAVFGILIVLTGFVLVPLPGPGWLIVFLGLAVLGTEFRWARRLSGWLKRMLARFWEWQKQRRAARRAARA